MPLDYPVLVGCDRKVGLRLTEHSCAKFWALSNPIAPPIWDGRHACHQCPAGARRNGTVIDPFSVLQDRLAPICPRCCNITERGDRKSAIINGRLCVSCYNREREVSRGRNAKGTRPRLTGSIGAMALCVVRGGKPELAVLPGVTGFIEVAIATARHASGPVAFGRCRPIPRAFMRLPPAPPPHQPFLWPTSSHACPRARLHACTPARLRPAAGQMALAL